MNDFWISCGHHLLDRDEGGGLLLTDDFLKVYMARPELIPPPEACVVERTLHSALLADPRMKVSASDIAADIQRYLQHEPVSAVPVGLVYRLRTFVWKHHVIFAAETILAV